jgi:hypothetical protein
MNALGAAGMALCACVSTELFRAVMLNNAGSIAGAGGRRWRGGVLGLALGLALVETAQEGPVSPGPRRVGSAEGGLYAHHLLHER